MNLASEQDIEAAAGCLRGGGVVAFPTETVYGLGANALDADAVAKVFAAKDRPSFDPLIVHTASIQAAWDLVDPATWEAQGPAMVTAQKLAEAFWPGPLTLVLPKAAAVPGIVTSGLPTVGLRVPGHALARQLIEQAGVPLAAPSANMFGAMSPTRAEHVTVPCDLVLDGGPCTTGVESTVVAFDAADQPVILRLGGLAVEAIEAVVGGSVQVLTLAEVESRLPEAGAVPGAVPGDPRVPGPGMLGKHYAPRTPLRLVERLGDVDPDEWHDRRVGLLSLAGDTGGGAGFAAVEALSPLGDLTAAAARLFDAMHRLDAAELELIVAEAVPEQGLGRAINDRLRRASTR